jgi:hypothetical protein
LRDGVAQGVNDAYTTAATKYRPKGETQVLFIAEAPPNSIDRYFYFEDVEKGDWLWIGLMKVLYAQDWKETKEERKRKRWWLARLRDDGFQLIDAVTEPIEGKSLKRVSRIKLNTDRLLRVIREISPKQIVLIKKTVHDALFEELKAAGLPVINSNAIPFPSSGRQRQFHEDLSKLKLSRKIFKRNDQ